MLVFDTVDDELVGKPGCDGVVTELGGVSVKSPPGLIPSLNITCFDWRLVVPSRFKTGGRIGGDDVATPAPAPAIAVAVEEAPPIAF